MTSHSRNETKNSGGDFRIWCSKALCSRDDTSRGQGSRSDLRNSLVFLALEEGINIEVDQTASGKFTAFKVFEHCVGFYHFLYGGGIIHFLPLAVCIGISHWYDRKAYTPCENTKPDCADDENYSPLVGVSMKDNGSENHTIQISRHEEHTAPGTLETPGQNLGSFTPVFFVFFKVEVAMFVFAVVLVAVVVFVVVVDDVLYRSYGIKGGLSYALLALLAAFSLEIFIAFWYK